MKITIRRKDIVSKSPCPDGLAWFDDFKEQMGVPKNKVLTIEWDPLSMLWALTNTEYRDRARWAIDNNLLPFWRLSDVDLSGADLSGADLSGADLSRADLSGADLSGADLTRADIHLASLRGTNLSGANLSGANLSFAELAGANLGDARLMRATLYRSELRDSDLSGANLAGAYYPKGPLPDGWRRTETDHLTKA